MAEIGNVNNRGGVGLPPAGTPDAATRDATNIKPTAATPVGQPGALGQPTGLPVPIAPGQTGQILPDVLAGSDPSQMIAAENLRARGGESATDELLGLHQRPSMLGAFPAPPGNSEALRHMTPTARRNAVRELLAKQRERTRRLALRLRQEQDGEESSDHQRQRNNEAFTRLLDDADNSALDENQRTRARAELSRAASMLDLLDDLLAMQDYTLSQMGTFSQG